jgi:hypothetical protein
MLLLLLVVVVVNVVAVELSANNSDINRLDNDLSVNDNFSVVNSRKLLAGPLVNISVVTCFGCCSLNKPSLDKLSGLKNGDIAVAK